LNNCCNLISYCFDTVGWVARRAIGPYKIDYEVLALLSVWSEVQMISTWSSWCHCCPIISCFIKIQNCSAFLVSAYPSCPWKEAVKWV